MTAPDNFARLSSAMLGFLHDRALRTRDRRWLEEFVGSETFRSLPAELSGQGDRNLLFMLRIASESLLAAAEYREFEALAGLARAVAWDLPNNGFTTNVRRLGVALADRMGDAYAGAAFRHAQLQRPSGDLAYLASAELLFETLDVDWFQEPASQEAPYQPGSLLDWPLPASLPRVVRGHRRAPGESTDRVSVSLVLAVDPYRGHVLIDQGVLRNETDGDPLGRIGSDDATYADLALVVGPHALPLAQALFRREAIRLRMVFGSTAYFDFDTAGGSLSVADADALRFTLRLPAPWLERDEPLGALLAEIEEVVFTPRTERRFTS